MNADVFRTVTASTSKHEKSSDHSPRPFSGERVFREAGRVRECRAIFETVVNGAAVDPGVRELFDKSPCPDLLEEVASRFAFPLRTALSGAKRLRVNSRAG